MHIREMFSVYHNITESWKLVVDAYNLCVYIFFYSYIFPPLYKLFFLLFIELGVLGLSCGLLVLGRGVLG